MKRCVGLILALCLLVLTAGGAPAADKKPVKLLGMAVLSGKAGAFPESAWGWEDGASFINETRGGIAGRPFKVIIEDGQYDVPVSVSNLQRVLAAEPEDELLFHCGFHTGVLQAIKEKVAETKIICIDGSMATHIFTDNVQKEYPYYFSTGIPYGDQTGALLKYIKTELHKGKQGKPKVAFVYIEAAAGRDPLDKLKMYAKKFDVDLMVEPVTFTTTDHTPTVMKIRQAKADYTILWSWSTSVSARFEKVYRKFFPKKPLLGLSNSAWETMFKSAGKAHDGMLFTSPFPRANETDNNLVKIILDTAGKKDRKIVLWDIYLQAFLMSLMAAEGADRAADQGPLTRQSARDALEGITNWDFYGMYGGKPVNYSLHRMNRFRILQAEWETKSNAPRSQWYDIEEYLKK
jgi:branched-chain amino acid transport system substrate-binding protein